MTWQEIWSIVHSLYYFEGLRNVVVEVDEGRVTVKAETWLAEE